MVVVRVKRFAYSDRSTIGDLSVQDEPISQTIELSCYKPDEKGLLAILPGTYRLVRRDYVSKRFGDKMWEIMKVPVPGTHDEYRTDLLIHPANKAEELDGCIAPGIYSDKLPNWVSSSRVCYAKFLNKLDDAIASDPDKQVFIEIIGTNPGPHE